MLRTTAQAAGFHSAIEKSCYEKFEDNQLSQGKVAGNFLPHLL